MGCKSSKLIRTSTNAQTNPSVKGIGSRKIDLGETQLIKLSQIWSRQHLVNKTQEPQIAFVKRFSGSSPAMDRLRVKTKRRAVLAV